MRRKRVNYTAVFLLIAVLILLTVTIVMTAVLVVKNTEKKGADFETISQSSVVNGEVLGNNPYDGTDADNTGNSGQNTGEVAIPNSVIVNSNTEHPSLRVLEIKSSNYGDVLSEKLEFAYDFDSNGENETYELSFTNENDAINVVVKKQEESVILYPLSKVNYRDINICVVNNRKKNGFAIIESDFVSGDRQMGSMKATLFCYQNGKFEMIRDFFYSGAANALNNMEKGIVEELVYKEPFSYDANNNMNGYIYNRSDAMADFKEYGIYLPKETIGEYQVGFGYSPYRLIKIEEK